MAFSRHPLRHSVLLPCLAAAMTAVAGSEQYRIDPTHTAVTFEIPHLGISTQRGRFSHASGLVTLDASAGHGSADILIDARSVTGGSDAMDALLRGEDLFDVDHFPEIHYVATDILWAEGKPDRILGDLTFHGVTHPVELRVTGYGCTRRPLLVQLRCGLDAKATLHRSDFGVTRWINYTADDVQLLIQVEAVRLPPAPPNAPGGFAPGAAAPETGRAGSGR